MCMCDRERVCVCCMCVCVCVCCMCVCVCKVAWSTGFLPHPLKFISKEMIIIHTLARASERLRMQTRRAQEESEQHIYWLELESSLIDRFEVVTSLQTLAHLCLSWNQLATPANHWSDNNATKNGQITMWPNKRTGWARILGTHARLLIPIAHAPILLLLHGGGGAHSYQRSAHHCACACTDSTYVHMSIYLYMNAICVQ